MGLDAMLLVFWMLSFKPTLSLSSFTLIKRFFLPFCGVLPNLVICFPRVYLATFCGFSHLVIGIRYDPIRYCMFSLVYSFIRYLFNMNYMPGIIWWTALIVICILYIMCDKTDDVTYITYILLYFKILRIKLQRKYAI